MSNKSHPLFGMMPKSQLITVDGKNCSFLSRNGHKCVILILLHTP